MIGENTTMKKKTMSSVLCLMVLVLVLSACGKGEVLTKSYEKKSNEGEIVISYKYQGDIVNEQSTENKVPFSALGVTTKEEAEELLAPLVEQYKGLKGVTHKITYSDSEAVESVTVNFEEADFEQLRDVIGMDLGSGSNKNIKISLKKSEDDLKLKGYVEKK
jgi:uncharacterized lipoprotein YehR (DUF1307 family)